MARAWIRKEVQRNPMAVWLEGLFDYLGSHRETSIGIGVTLIAGVVLGTYFYVRQAEFKDEAWKRYAVAQHLAYSGEPEKLAQAIADLTQNYAQTDAAAFGLLFQGDLLYRQGSFQQAIDAYSKLVEGRGPQEIRTFARSGLGFSLMSAGKLAEAEKQFNLFLEAQSEHYLAPQVHLALGRVLEAQGKGADALQAFEKIAVLYPQTPWAQMAQARIPQKKAGG